MDQPSPKKSKRSRILVLSAKGWNTGSALRAFYISEALRKAGHEVVFLKPLPTLPLWLDMALSLPYYFLYSLFLKCDAAFCVKPYPTVVPALWVQRRKGARIVLDVDDLDYAYSRGAFGRFHRWIQEPWPKWADLVTYHNPKLREPLLSVFQVPPGKLLRLDQGVDLSIFHPGPLDPADLPPATAEWLAYQTSCRILVFTAHLSHACDLGEVLKAFSLLLQDLPGARLVVAGGGPDQDRFERQAERMGISGFLHFTGYLTPRQVSACLKAGDLSLAYYGPAPANEHRASMKLREALACGLKVAATSVGEASAWGGALFLSSPSPLAYEGVLLKALKARRPPAGAAKLVKSWDWSLCVKPLEEELQRP